MLAHDGGARRQEEAQMGARRSPEDLGHRILLWLLRHSFQRVEDITLALGCHPATTYRYVAQYEQAGLIESITPALSIRDTCRLYYLSERGIQRVALPLRADPSALARFWGANERGLLRMLPRLHSLITLQNFINRLVKEAPGALAPPDGRRADLIWNWLLDYEHRFTYRGKTVSAHADAILVFQRTAPDGAEERSCFLPLWILLDTGLTGEHDGRLIRGRLEELLRLRESVEWREHYDRFPPILVLVPTARQQALWQRCAREAAASFRQVAPLSGAISIIAPDASYLSAWHLSWHDIATGAPVHIQKQLIQVAPDALPVHALTPDPGASRSTARSGAGVTGNFARRAKAVSATIKNDTEAELEAVSLLGLFFSHRQIEVLQCVYTYPLCQIWELAEFCDLSYPAARRYLSDLRHHSCVQKCETDEGPRWSLTSRGRRLTAMLHHFALLHIATPRRKKGETRAAAVLREQERLRRQIHHMAGIYTFFAHLSRALRAVSGQILWWELAARCEHRYRDGGTWHNFRPDASLECELGGRRVRAWLEYDLGTMDASHLRRKLEACAYYIQSRKWVEEGTTALPLLLFVVPDKSQFQRLAVLLREILAATDLVVRIATATRIEHYGPLADIWQEVLPMRSGKPFVLRRFLDTTSDPEPTELRERLPAAKKKTSERRP